jgi:hypothetical protein
MADVVKTVVINIEAVDKNAVKTFKNITRSTEMMTKGSKQFITTTEHINGAVTKTTSELSDARQQFKMYYLSMMFGGWQIQRAMGGIYKSSIDTFMKITEGQTAAGMAVTGLAAAWTYLQFSVGNAIAGAMIPLLDIMIPLIESFADFAQTHPDLIFTAIVGALTAGTVIAAFASWKLFIDGWRAFTLSSDAKDFFKSGGALEKLQKLAGVGMIISASFQIAENIFSGKAIDITKFLGALMKAVGGMAMILIPGPKGWAIGITMYILGEIYPEIYNALNSFGVWFAVYCSKLNDLFNAIWSFDTGRLNAAANSLAKFLKEGVPKAAPLLMMGDIVRQQQGAAEMAKLNIPSYQTGGYVQNTGLAMLHAGETVTPANTTNVGGITINVNGSGDPRRVAEEVSSILSDRIHNYANPTTGRMM